MNGTDRASNLAVGELKLWPRRESLAIFVGAGPSPEAPLTHPTAILTALSNRALYTSVGPH